MPYSRATIELWLSGPPMSVTTAAAIANSEVQAGVVMLATSTSPGSQPAEVAGPSSTRAVAVTRPALAPMPLEHVPGLVLRRRRQHRPNRLDPARPLGQQLRRVARRWPRQISLRARSTCASGSAGRGQRSRLAPQPEHVLGAVDDARSRPAAGPARAASGAAAARPVRCRPARPRGPVRAPGPGAAAGRTRRAADRVQPRGDRGASSLPPLAERGLPLVRVGPSPRR